jgi:UDP-N-acetylglucosamine 2-epimerase
MTIEFNHLNNPVSAFIFYNLKQAGNAFLFTPLSFQDDLGEKIFIYKIENVWKTDSGLNTDFPETFSNMITAIKKISKTSLNSDSLFLSHEDEIKQAEQHEDLKKRKVLIKTSNEKQVASVIF